VWILAWLRSQSNKLPFVERLIGTIRRECLDHTLFWNARDLEQKLADFQVYYNRQRTHGSLGGNTPAEMGGGVSKRRAAFNKYRWESHCRGLYQLPVAARLTIRQGQAKKMITSGFRKGLLPRL